MSGPSTSGFWGLWWPKIFSISFYPTVRQIVSMNYSMIVMQLIQWCQSLHFAHVYLCVYACVCIGVCRFIHDACVCPDCLPCALIHSQSVSPRSIAECVCPDCSPCALVHSQSVSSRSIAECVWSQYLSMREEAFSLSPAQQQEMCVQYSALQIALQVSF